MFVGQSNGVIRRARRLLTNYTSAPHLSLAAPTLAVSTAPCFADVRRILYENINTPLKLATDGPCRRVLKDATEAAKEGRRAGATSI